MPVSKIKEHILVHRHMIVVLLACLFLGFQFPPEGITTEGWKVLTIFILTLGLIITKTFDMGIVSLIALSLCLITGAMDIDFCLQNFSYQVTWLVLMAFFISKGFILSGLGSRIALFMASKIGSTPLKLSYALMFSEVLIAPLIPSNTARGGGLIFPIAQSLGENIFGKPHGLGRNKHHMTSYLLYNCFQSNLISSAIFLTAMAGNPMIVSMGQQFGITINWTDWFQAAIIPGLICIFLTPLISYLILKPKKVDLNDIKQKTEEAYRALGSFSIKEKIMAFTFCSLLLAWIMGAKIGINPTAAAIIAVTFLLVTGVLSWNDISTDSQAWTTFVWLSVLFTLSAALKNHGVISWFAAGVGSFMPEANWVVLLIILTLVNFYVHYFFASLTSHITTFFQPLMMIGMQLAVPLKPLLLALAFSTSLSAGLTHYGTGTSTIIFGSGYWNLKDWWVAGFIHSSLMLVVFLAVGLPLWI